MPLPCDLDGRPHERVVRQFAEALLFERLVDAASATLANDETRFAWQGAGAEFRARGIVAGFGRIRLSPGSVEVRRSGADWEQADIAALCAAVPGEHGDRATLRSEIERTAALCRWNSDHLPPRSRRELGFADLDAAIGEGHPYHPCFKARSGFSVADHEAYGPECGRGFRLHWLAVDLSLLHRDLPAGGREFLSAEIGPENTAFLFARCADRGLDARACGLVPVHPWQSARLRDDLAPLVTAGLVHPLGEAGPLYRASQSVRSLTRADGIAGSAIKLPMDMVNTTTLRTFDPHCVVTAPAISGWLAGIVDSDRVFAARHRLAIMREHAAVVVDRDGPLGGRIGAIWRTGIDEMLAPGEAAVPLNALMNREHDGRPFVDDWIARWGLRPWIARLIEVAVLPVWHLLLAHGIATEAHGQNMILVHRHGWPERLILRDFHDSVEYVPDFLAAPERVPDLAAIDPVFGDAAPGRFYRMGEVGALRDLVVDCLFVYNLSEIAHLLAVAYGHDERQFWASVGASIRAHCAEHGLDRRLAQLDPFRDRIQTESLLSRKLKPARDCEHAVANALAMTAPAASEAA